MPNREIVIYHTNDLHNRVEVFPLLRGVPRDKNTIFLDGGDALGGSNTLFYLHEPIIALMNEVGYTAMAMGNREFHYLRGVLKRRYRCADFPILSANVKDLTGKCAHYWKDHIIADVDGIRLAITGLTPVQFPGDSFLTRLTGFLFLPPEEALSGLIERLKEKEAHLIIVLSHLGYEDDEKLAKACNGIDLIIGGHSHTLIRDPVKVNGACIVQSGCYGAHVGRIAINLNGHSLSSLKYELISTSCKDREKPQVAHEKQGA